MPHVYVAAGSNVDADRNLTLAASELAREFPDIRFSPWYRNHAVGFEGDDFINGAVAFTTTLSLEELLKKLHAIEKLCGRPRDAAKWAPRSMDLDVLMYDDVVSAEARLPRPDLLKRAYMLGPLADIAPEAMHPTAGLTIGELWNRFDKAAHPMERLEGGLPFETTVLTSPRSVPRPPQGSDP